MTFLHKCIRHLNLIVKHKIEVGKACFAAGIYWRGITHDLSKFQPIEFIEYAQYYNGEMSPVDMAKKSKGYCNAWQHHKGHNPHHYEYWVDKLDDGGVALIMPYKYALEMVCDYIGAGKTYEKEKWDYDSPLKYWNKKRIHAKIHPKTREFLDTIFHSYSQRHNAALNKNVTKILYDKICKV